MSIKTLLENSVLNEETKVVVQEAFEQAVAAKEQELKESYEVKLEADLLEATSKMRQLVQESMQEVVAEEMEAIAEEIKHARTLEVQYAEKLTQFKEDYAANIQEQVEAATAEIVAEEFNELKDDVAFAKKHQFAMNMFESFKETYERMFGETEDTVHEQLAEAKQELEALKRESILTSILESLTGSKRKIAETILESTATDKLEEKFESIKSFLLAEAKKDVKEEDDGEEKDEKEGKVVLDEEDEEKEDKDEKKDEKEEVIKESVDPLMIRLSASLRHF